MGILSQNSCLFTNFFIKILKKVLIKTHNFAYTWETKKLSTSAEQTDRLWCSKESNMIAIPAKQSTVPENQ
jgi:hypothetical protein